MGNNGPSSRVIQYELKGWDSNDIEVNRSALPIVEFTRNNTNVLGLCSWDYLNDR